MFEINWIPLTFFCISSIVEKYKTYDFLYYTLNDTQAFVGHRKYNFSNVFQKYKKGLKTKRKTFLICVFWSKVYAKNKSRKKLFFFWSTCKTFSLMFDTNTYSKNFICFNVNYCPLYKTKWKIKNFLVNPSESPFFSVRLIVRNFVKKIQ